MPHLQPGFAFIEAMNIDGVTGREEVTRCLQAFQAKANPAIFQPFVARCYERWQEHYTQQHGSGKYCFSVQSTVLDYAVVAYLSLVSTPQSLQADIEKSENAIRELPLQWHASLSHFLTMYNLILSRLQLYYLAWRIGPLGKITLSHANRYLLPSWLANDSYYRLMFEIDRYSRSG